MPYPRRGVYGPDSDGRSISDGEASTEGKILPFRPLRKQMDFLTWPLSKRTQLG